MARPKCLTIKSGTAKTTLLVFWSRRWMFDRHGFWPHGLHMPEETELIVVLDTDDEEFVELVEAVIYDLPFSAIKLIATNQKPFSDNGQVHHRRDRIRDIFNLSKKYIGDTEYLFCIEDDSVCNPFAYWGLQTYVAHGACIASGVEVGRHAIRHIGAWIINRSQYRSVYYCPCPNPYSSVDAVGAYCFVTRTEYYKQFEHVLFPFLGPDVGWSNAVKRATGRPIVLDWSTKVDHYLENGNVLKVEEPIDVVVWEEKPQGWRSGVEKQPNHSPH